jgi:hypothetical protein
MSTNPYITSPSDDILLDNMSSDTYTITSASPYWGTSGAVITTGANGYNWNDISLTNSVMSVDESAKALTIKGDAEFNGNLTVGGVNLMEALEKIEQRLNILRVDTELEARWNELKELGERYRALEAECLDKEYIIDILKK